MAATKREKRRREEDTTVEASPGPYELPPDIIREILIRLPVKSIGRFRSVSKLFCSLSSDPGFAKIHLDLTTRNDSLHCKLLVSSENLYALGLDSIGHGSKYLVAPQKSLSGFDEMINSYWRDRLNIIGPAEDEDDRLMRRMMKVKLYQRSYVKIIGSWNGLVCISPWEGAVFLFNPTTGDSRRLPEPTVERYQTHGFGFDDRTDDYKVVKLVADKNHRVHNASVYSLKADSWRRICDLNYKLSGGFVSGVNVKGAVHWLLTDSHRQRVILSFDVKTEEFREMSFPVEAEDCSHRFRNFTVGDLNGSLSVIYSCDEDHDDIWVMNEYGVASSWRRIRISLLYKRMKPLCSTENNEEVLMDVDGNAVLYNFKTNALRNLGKLGLYKFKVDTYVESLISPNLYGVEN